jgi:hypothetical protein
MVFEKLIPADHYLRRLKAAIDFEPCRALVADCYAAGMGAPAEDPVRLLKLSLLQFQYDLSDSQVLRHAQGNVAFWFFRTCPWRVRCPCPARSRSSARGWGSSVSRSSSLSSRVRHGRRG